MTQAPPYDMGGSCTNNESEYLNFDRVRCSDPNTNWLVWILLASFVLIIQLVCALFRALRGRAVLPTIPLYFIA